MLVGDDGRARVVDFGLAALGEPTLPPPEPAQLAGNSRSGSLEQGTLTHVGTLLGTPLYMAPEQLERGRAQAASDQFAFCVALHEGLYGARPFTGETLAALSAAIERGPPEPPRRSRVPERVRRALVRGLAVAPSARHPDMPALLASLEAALARPLRVWAAALTLALALAVGLMVHAQRRQADAEARLAALAGADETTCVGAEAEIVAAWDPGRAAALTAGFTATGLAYAAREATAVQARLDARASEWTAAHRRLCLAHQRGELSPNLYDRGLSCLYERRAALASLIRLLVAPDATIVDDALEAVARLPGTEECTSADLLLRGTPATYSPEQLARIDAARNAIAELTVEVTLHPSDDLRERIDRVVTDAREIGDPGVIARALRHRGLHERAQGAIDAAMATLSEAWSVALAGGADLEALRVASRAVYTLIEELRVPEARVWLTSQQALLRRVGGGTQDDEFDVREHEAMIAWESGDKAAAVTLLEELGRTLAARDADNPRRLRLLINLASLRNLRGDYRGALADHQQALTLREALYGPDHPFLIKPLEGIGIAFDNLGDYPRAQASYRRALDLTTRFRGPDHPNAAYLRNNLGESLYREGRHAEAAAEFASAAAMLARSGRPGHPLVGLARVGEGNALQRLGRIDEAHAAYVASEVAFAELPAENPMRAYAKVGLAQVALRRGRFAEALRLTDQADALRSDGNTQRPERAEVAFLHAQLRVRDPATRAAALADAACALALYDEAGPGFAGPRAEVDAWLRAHPKP